ncbi:MAG: hypothetical protein HYV63_32530 [Candidatus Schekmanbacteria bacterium]|nr:hypothetical protein [Candidatus Schekmanbacteria bacterium]
MQLASRDGATGGGLSAKSPGTPVHTDLAARPAGPQSPRTISSATLRPSASVPGGAVPRGLQSGVDLQSRDLAPALRGTGVTLAELRGYDDVDGGGNTNGILEGAGLGAALRRLRTRPGVDYAKLVAALKVAAGVVPAKQTTGDRAEVDSARAKITRLQDDLKHVRTQEGYYCDGRRPDYDGYACGAAEQMRVDAEIALARAREDLAFWRQPLQRHLIQYRNGVKVMRYYSSAHEGNRLLRTRTFDARGRVVRDVVPERLRSDGGAIMVTTQRDGTVIRLHRNKYGEALHREVRLPSGAVTLYRFFPGSPAQRGIELVVPPQPPK